MQESGLTEIIPLICISAIGACPMLSHPEYPQGSPLGVAVWLLLKVLFAQLRPTLCNTMDSSLPGSSVYGILQARMLSCVAIPFSRGSSQAKDQTQVSCITGRLFTSGPSRKPCGGFQNAGIFSSPPNSLRAHQHTIGSGCNCDIIWLTSSWHHMTVTSFVY